jgi:hypothetical protein
MLGLLFLQHNPSHCRHHPALPRTAARGHKQPFGDAPIVPRCRGFACDVRHRQFRSRLAGRTRIKLFSDKRCIGLVGRSLHKHKPTERRDRHQRVSGEHFATKDIPGNLDSLRRRTGHRRACRRHLGDAREKSVSRGTRLRSRWAIGSTIALLAIVPIPASM